MAEAKNTLVIVESPAKAKTIGKFLGNKFKVVASNGHVRDLPKSQLGIDTAHDFTPKYITLRGRGDVLERIKKEAKEGIPVPYGYAKFIENVLAPFGKVYYVGV